MNEFTLHEVQDDNFEMKPILDVEHEPHLLMSKVRTHYMEYILKLLTVNYENNQRLINKDIVSPSAIWKCAKNIEMTAANNSMIVHLYRKNIVAVIKELKHDTKKGRLYKNLYDCVDKPPEIDKEVQTSISKTSDCTCQCVCDKRKKRRKDSISPNDSRTDHATATTINTKIYGGIQDSINCTIGLSNSVVEAQKQDVATKTLPSEPPPKLSNETQDSDLLIKELEMIFQDDCNDDDPFEHSLCSAPNSSLLEVNTNKSKEENTEMTADRDKQNMPLKSFNHQSIDEHIASLAGQFVNPNESNVSKAFNEKHQRRKSSKWLCEEYFLKSQLFELLDHLRDCNRAKLARIKELLLNLFGDDSDDEDVMSPLDESQAFIVSCNERVAPWVVRTLNPFYNKGRIKERSLFKSLAKHLINLIYQCSKYPTEFEVKSFVFDFLENHKIIRCEADFKQFRIDNI